MIKGVSLSPKSFNASDFTDFFKKAKQTGRIVSWAGDWNEVDLASANAGGPKVVTELASTYDYIPLIELQFFTQSNGQLLRSLDETNAQRYKKEVGDFAARYKPKYLALGIEVNTLYEKSPQDFDRFVSLYDGCYDEIKSRSPNTKVFTIFQLEKMKGLNGGLFGGANDPSKAQWPLLERFPKSDLIAFTTYPDLIYKKPSEIPQDYYSEIKTHTTKRIAFTELGWHSAASPTGWESDEREQAEFVSVFFNLTRDMGEDFVIWSFLYDQNTSQPFNSMGLYDVSGTPKLALEAWKKQ